VHWGLEWCFVEAVRLFGMAGGVMGEMVYRWCISVMVEHCCREEDDVWKAGVFFGDVLSTGLVSGKRM